MTDTVDEQSESDGPLQKTNLTIGRLMNMYGVALAASHLVPKLDGQLRHVIPKVN